MTIKLTNNIYSQDGTAMHLINWTYIIHCKFYSLAVISCVPLRKDCKWFSWNIRLNLDKLIEGKDSIFPFTMLAMNIRLMDPGEKKKRQKYVKYRFTCILNDTQIEKLGSQKDTSQLPIGAWRIVQTDQRMLFLGGTHAYVAHVKAVLQNKWKYF